VSALKFGHWGIRKFPRNDPLDGCPFHVVVATIDGFTFKLNGPRVQRGFLSARGLGRPGVFGRLTLKKGTVALHQKCGSP
jgi:hypothetical protein